MGEANKVQGSVDTSQGLSVQLPFQLGRFTLCQELGAGGMATVYLGRMKLAEGFERLVAVKTIHGHLAKEQTFVDMFLDEANIATQIGHPNVCSVYDFGNVGGTYFLALEYLMGEPLDDFINSVVDQKSDDLMRTLPFLGARIIADAAEGLHAAHETRGADGERLNVVHRDVSPQNLFITYDGAVKLVDFGCAKAVERVTQTDTGVMKGKVSYAAPEQLKGEPLDSRVDVWALGVCLWETLTLRELFRRDTAIQSAMAVLEEDIPRADAVAEWVPTELGEICQKALQRDREDRYQSARDLGRDLRTFIARAGVSFESAELAEWMEHLFDSRQDEVREMVREVEEGARRASAAQLDSNEGPAVSGVTGIESAATKLAKIPSSQVPADSISVHPPPADETVLDPAVQLASEYAPRSEPSLKLRLDQDEEPITLPTKGRGVLFFGVAFALLVAGFGGLLWQQGDGDLAVGWARLTGATPETVEDEAPAEEFEIAVEPESPEEAAADDVPEELVVVGETDEEAAGGEPRAEPSSATPNSATPNSATPNSATPNSATPTSAASRSPSGRAAATPSTAPPTAAADATDSDEEVGDAHQPSAGLDPSRGEVHVLMEGGWAQVFHNGRDLGRTPLRLSLPVGRQTLRLLPSGEGPGQTAEVQVEWGAVSRVRLRAPRPAPAPAPAPEAAPEPEPEEPASEPRSDNPYDEGGEFRENEANPYD